VEITSTAFTGKAEEGLVERPGRTTIKSLKIAWRPERSSLALCVKARRQLRDVGAAQSTASHRSDIAIADEGNAIAWKTSSSA